VAEAVNGGDETPYWDKLIIKTIKGIMILEVPMATTRIESVNVADAKRRFSDLLGRVAYGGETVLITRRGRPMAKLVPPEAPPGAEPLGSFAGWLEEDDPYFAIVDEIVTSRGRHQPRVTGRGAARSRRSR
jgi:prevent-host-death family protein